MVLVPGAFSERHLVGILVHNESASKVPYITSNRVPLNTMRPLELDGAPGQEPVGPKNKQEAAYKELTGLLRRQWDPRDRWGPRPRS